MWTDPGVRLMDDAMPILDVLARRAPHRVAAAVAGMDDCSFHQPEHAHVLHLVGVHPDLAGRGVGTRLLEPRLSAIDNIGGVTYLESSSRRNHSFYHRLGFGQLAEVRIGDGPSIWPMARRGSAMYQPSDHQPVVHFPLFSYSGRQKYATGYRGAVNAATRHECAGRHDGSTSR